VRRFCSEAAGGGAPRSDPRIGRRLQGLRRIWDRRSPAGCPRNASARKSAKPTQHKNIRDASAVNNHESTPELEVRLAPFSSELTSFTYDEGIKMRNSLVIAALLAFVAGGAIAQTQSPPAKDGPQNSAINTQDSSNRQVNAPVAGANSFTQGEAKSRIEKMGFANVSDLNKDDDGVWRGRAMKDGKTVEVSLDYQGNVIEAGSGTTGPSNAAQGAGR
jgi:hypothetical protein